MAALSLYILTFNCGRMLIQPDVFAAHLFDALPNGAPELPDILVISLQEIAPLGYSFLGGSFLTPYFGAFRQAVDFAAKQTFYVNSIARSVGMTGIMVFVKEELSSNIAWMETAGVGVGVQEMGNKGAVGVRMGYIFGEEEPVEMTFVAAHLAPMEDALQRRNEDYKEIVRKLVFVSDGSKSPAKDEQSEDAPLLQGLPSSKREAHPGMYGSRSHLFFAGDLNYRVSETKPTPEDVNKFPQPTNDTNDSRHFSKLLEKDQLTQQLRQDKALHGMTEAPINFPPTYKYGEIKTPLQTDEVGQWNWATHRWPSWCDRILFLDPPSWMPADVHIKVGKYTALPLFSTSDHRPVALSVSLPLQPIAEGDAGSRDVRLQPPYPIDPDWKAKRDLARKKEIAVGLAAYLSWTWEGNGLLLATIVGSMGGWLILRSLLEA